MNTLYTIAELQQKLREHELELVVATGLTSSRYTRKYIALLNERMTIIRKLLFLAERRVKKL